MDIIINADSSSCESTNSPQIHTLVIIHQVPGTWCFETGLQAALVSSVAGVIIREFLVKSTS